MRHHPAHPDYHRSIFNSVVHGPLALPLALGVAAGGGGALAGMSTLGAVGLGLGAAGIASQAVGTIAAGNAQQAAANYQAAQLNQQAGQARASSQRDAANQQRTAAYALSRAQAVAAGSGGNTLDPTIVNAEQNIAGEGEYNQATALFNGEERARGLEQNAATDVYQGSLDKQASEVKAISTIASGGGSMLMKYGSPFSSSNSYAPGGANNPVNASGDSTMDPEFAAQYGF